LTVDLNFALRVNEDVIESRMKLNQSFVAALEAIVPGKGICSLLIPMFGNSYVVKKFIFTRYCVFSIPLFVCKIHHNFLLLKVVQNIIRPLIHVGYF